MSNKTIRRKVILLIVFITVIYFGLRLFIDIPPKIDANIDFLKTNTLKNFSEKETLKMWKTYENSGFF